MTKRKTVRENQSNREQFDINYTQNQNTVDFKGNRTHFGASSESSNWLDRELLNETR